MDRSALWVDVPRWDAEPSEYRRRVIRRETAAAAAPAAGAILVAEHTVLLVHDDPEALAMLAAALEGAEFAVCGAIGEPEAVSHVLATTAPDVCVVRFCAPNVVVTLVAEMRRHAPGTRILVLCGNGGDGEFFGVLEAGADAYLDEPFDPSTIPSVLRRLLADERVMSATVVERILDEFRRRSRVQALRDNGDPGLTPREIEVLELMSTGLSTRQMAKRLFVAPVTVRSHVAALLHKLHLSDRESAVAFFNEFHQPPEER